MVFSFKSMKIADNRVNPVLKNFELPILLIKCVFV